MIEAIIDIGEKILSHQDIVDSRIVKVGVLDNKGNPKKIVFINFDTILGKVNFEAIEMDEDTVCKYLYLGREGGPNSNQMYVTLTNPSSLMSEVVSQLIKMNIPDDKKEKLNFILNKFYYNFGEKVTPKYRYMLDLHNAGVMDESMEEIYIKHQDRAKPYKDVQIYLQRELLKYIEKNTGAKEKQIGLFTLSVDGEAIGSSDWYRALVKNKLTDKSKEKNSKGKLICSYCGSYKECTSDLSRMSIKYYTTNQVIFANNFDAKNYCKNMVLCRNCRDKLFTGEKFILNQMRGKISKLDVYIIPHIVYGKYKFDADNLYKLSAKLKQTLNTANNIENLEKFKYGLQKLKEASGGNYYLINLVFYKKMNQATKILKLIKDIDPGVFYKMGKSTNKSLVIFEKYFPQLSTTRGILSGLNLIYYMTPVRLSRKLPVQYQNVLNIYEALFYGRRLSRRQIISNIVKCYKICWFEQDEYNVSSSGNKDYIDYKIAYGLYYVLFLENMGNLERGDIMDASDMSLKDNYKKYIKDMAYDPQQTSLFLLGCLVGAVGRKQNSNKYKKDPDNKGGGKYKPVLNKINFNGMEYSKIIRLSNEILNKLRQEDILKYNEDIFFEHKRLLGLNEKSWKYNKDENLYYILSGYAFETMKKKEDNLNE